MTQVSWVQILARLLVTSVRVYNHNISCIVVKPSSYIGSMQTLTNRSFYMKWDLKQTDTHCPIANTMLSLYACVLMHKHLSFKIWSINSIRKLNSMGNACFNILVSWLYLLTLTASYLCLWKWIKRLIVININMFVWEKSFDVLSIQV